MCMSGKDRVFHPHKGKFHGAGADHKERRLGFARRNQVLGPRGRWITGTRAASHRNAARVSSSWSEQKGNNIR